MGTSRKYKLSIAGCLWNQLSFEKTEQELLSFLLEESEIGETTASADLSKFLAELKATDLFE